MPPYVHGRRIVTDDETWDLLAAPIENPKRPGTYVAPAVRASDQRRLALPMPADLALAWFMANPGNG
jgi:hypothetical protein